ncbi:MAG: nucleoside triphosphate pyrophosphohydrolase, partial [[Eubacterium] sulci]|nr:nucleoside triphosphate pyrophosphohydrolase [[Eubacterium] sulci]
MDAIDNNDFINLREELGDVLLQVVFHADLAREESHFDLKDVINDECEKMIRRHPHIFSEETAKTVDKVVEKWENVKSKEHGNTTHTQR